MPRCAETVLADAPVSSTVDTALSRWCLQSRRPIPCAAKPPPGALPQLRLGASGSDWHHAYGVRELRSNYETQGGRPTTGHCNTEEVCGVSGTPYVSNRSRRMLRGSRVRSATKFIPRRLIVIPGRCVAHGRDCIGGPDKTLRTRYRVPSRDHPRRPRSLAHLQVNESRSFGKRPGLPEGKCRGVRASRRALPGSAAISGPEHQRCRRNKLRAPFSASPTSP